jgi:hypothetical protein
MAARSLFVFCKLMQRFSLPLWGRLLRCLEEGRLIVVEPCFLGSLFGLRRNARNFLGTANRFSRDA